MKKMPMNKRQLKKLEKQYLSGAIEMMKNAKMRERLLARAEELFGKK